ncbi:hypothetical protein O3P69_000810 [Scylla paramamosain]|uniref:Poly(A) RNA polymerase mitochondrial-like central palm domain-containing protein n=1 Tax=Scylla paramamosain TaxID=85552 RepID=A0AAW0URU3_SCYPA
MEGAKSTEKNWARKCIVCDVNFSYKHAYILHLLGKRHQKNVRKRDRSQVNTVRNRTVCFSGRRDKITLEKIVEYFLEYGINNIVQQGNTVFIEFDSVEAAKIVLQKRNYKIRTTALRVFPMKHTNEDEATKVPISPSLKNCMSQGVTGSELDKYISFLIKEIELKPRELEARESLRRGIVNYLSPYFPKVVGHIFGSAANNLGFTGCDVDIYLDLGVYPWIECENKAAAQAEASDLTWFLAKRIRQSGHAIKVEPVPRARVPIVKFQDRASRIMVDLSFRHGMPVYNTQLIYQYTQTHPLVRPYLMVIRYWAKVQDVAGGGKPSILITNYALTMMMLFHLMHRDDPIVPSLAALRYNRATYTPVFIGPWDSIEVTPDMISDGCQGSSQLKEEDEVITLDDSDVSQDIEETSQDVEILAGSQETVDISQNCSNKKQEELESFGKRTDENKNQPFSSAVFENWAIHC